MMVRAMMAKVMEMMDDKGNDNMATVNKGSSIQQKHNMPMQGSSNSIMAQ